MKNSILISIFLLGSFINIFSSSTSSASYETSKPASWIQAPRDHRDTDVEAKTYDERPAESSIFIQNIEKYLDLKLTEREKREVRLSERDIKETIEDIGHIDLSQLGPLQNIIENILEARSESGITKDGISLETFLQIIEIQLPE